MHPLPLQKVAVPKVTADGRRVVFQPERWVFSVKSPFDCMHKPLTQSRDFTPPLCSEEDCMMARFKAGYIQDMVLLVNKPPKWNESVRVAGTSNGQHTRD